MKSNLSAVLAAIVGLMFIVVGMVVGLAFAHQLGSNAVVVTTVLGMCGNIIVSLMTHFKLTNGTIPEKIQEAVDKGIIPGAESTDTPNVGGKVESG